MKDFFTKRGSGKTTAIESLDLVINSRFNQDALSSLASKDLNPFLPEIT